MLVWILCGLVAATATFAVASKIISCVWARFRFKQLSRGIPLCPQARLLGNHASVTVFGKNTCQNLYSWHKELGDTIGAVLNSKFGVSTIDLDLIKTIIQDEPYAHINRGQLGLPVEEFEKSIMMAQRDEWFQIRPIVGAALASNKFKTPNVQQEIEASIGKLIEHIDRRLASQEPDHLFEVDDFAHKYSLDLIFRCFFKQEGLIDFDDPNDLWTTSNEQTFVRFQTSIWLKLGVIFPQLCNTIDWLMWHFTPEGRSRRKIFDFVKSQARLGMRARLQLQKLKKIAKETGSKIDTEKIVLDDGTEFKRNMIDHVIDKYLDGKLTKQQYLNNVAFLLAAGEKTAYDAIVHIIYSISINHQVQNELRNSIKLNGIDSEYLDWVLKEGLRLLPPVPAGCSRTIERDIVIENGKYVVPAGTFVLTNAYAIHRLKKYWGDDADEFKPERWRDTSNHHPLQYIPFGAGPRSCPGKMFAIHEIKMVLATLITRYVFEGEPRDDVYDFDSPAWIYLVPKSVTKVKIRRL